MLRITWTNPDARNYADLIPGWVWAEPDAPTLLEHSVVGPQGGTYRARCVVDRSAGEIRLGYDAADPLNASWGCYGGTTCIRLGEGGVPTAAWWAEVAQPAIDIGARIDFVDDLDAEEAWSRMASDLLGDSPTETQAFRNIRIGQGGFRDALDKRWDFRCALTGVGLRELLRASHIIPWASDTTARLDEANGLLLAAHVDALFGSYLISFGEDGDIIWSSSVPAETRDALRLPKRLRAPLTEREKARLAAHRKSLRGAEAGG